MGISIVIPSWEGRELLVELFSSLAEVSFSDDDEIIVVDGGSEDGTVEFVQECGRESSLTLDVIPLEKNLGFSGNVNAGLRAVRKGNDVVIMNNDVMILDPDVFEVLASVAMIWPKVGVLSPMILAQDGRIQAHGAFLLPFSHDGSHFCQGEKWTGQFAGVRECQYVPFVCAFIKAEVLKDIGLLDEEFFAYYEDVDFCLRAAAAGWKVASVTDTAIVHLGPATTSRAVGSPREILKASKEVFEAKWGDVLLAEWKESVIWVGELGYPTGYGVWARRAMKGALEAGVLTHYQTARMSGHEDVPSPEAQTRDCQRHGGDSSMVQIIIEHGDRLCRNSGRYRIGWVMCEVEPWPKPWVDGCRWVDEVWVPTESQKRVLLACGVERPVEVMPLGVDPGYFNPDRSPWPDRPSADFVFVSNFLWGVRKNPDLLIRAFRDEFDRDEDVVLYIKTATKKKGHSLALETRWWMRQSGPTVMITTDAIPDPAMAGLYTMGDCFVLPSSGEGWGLPALEALACGVPVIATGWGGPAEWGVDDDGEALPGMHFLDYELIPCRSDMKVFAGCSWADPSYDDLRVMMRAAYEEREEWKAEAMEGSKWVREHLTWRHVGEKIRERLEVVG